ncbi:hypothetical protein NFI96_003259 [Prochilodus magdalenae]|nr:hypothetical protein NFI96_003259 [Prochilodus magdalenae]
MDWLKQGDTSGTARSESLASFSLPSLVQVYNSVFLVSSDSSFVFTIVEFGVFSIAGLVQSLAMIHAVEMANTSPFLTRLGITLGYKIHDTCSDVTTALRAVEDFRQCYSTMDLSNMSSCFPPSAAVIGAYYSEMSIAVARELNLELIPQVSYASTADILSDKSRFPAFSRTVPNDMHQTHAMVKLLQENKWTWVGVITTDGDYGRSALDSFLSQAFQAGICVAFKEIFPDSVTSTQRLNSAVSRAVQTLQTNSKVRVVVSFAKPEHMSRLFKGLLDNNQSGNDQRVWVASDNWSTSQSVVTQEQLNRIGWVVGFSFESSDVTPLKEFLLNLELNSEIQKNNDFLKEFYSSSTNNSKEEVSMTTEKLINNIDAGKVFSIQMAVNAIAQAVAKLCSNRNCTTAGAIQPWELLPELRNSSYEMNGTVYTFNENGDVDLGYHISLWRTTGQRVQTLNVVSVYHQQNSSLTATNLKLNVTSKCSASCRAGQFKKSAEGQHTCCYECSNCPENQFSNGTGESTPGKHLEHSHLSNYTTQVLN